MDLCIGGRVALVTGASSGIGEAVAMALAAEGVKLVIAARRTELLGAIATRARAAGAAEARGFEVDLSSPDSVARLVDATHAAFGNIDILVLNGGGPKPGRFADVTLVDWDAAYRGLLRGMIQLVEATVPAGVTVSIATGRVGTARLDQLYGSADAVERAARAEVPVQRVATRHDQP